MKYDIAALKRKMLVKYPFFGSVVASVGYKENKDIPYSKNIVVPTKRVIEYLGLDIEFIKEMALKEQELEYMKHYGCRLDGSISK